MDLKLNFLLDEMGIDPVPVPVARIEQREVSREPTPCLRKACSDTGFCHSDWISISKPNWPFLLQHL